MGGAADPGCSLTKMSKRMNTEGVPREIGYTFPSAEAVLDRSMVVAYLDAVEATHPVYREGNIVPPMAIAALAFRSLAERMSLPPGTIHVSQEFGFHRAASVGDALTTRARISGKRARGKLVLMTVDLEVTNRDGDVVLSGKTTFLLPVDGYDGQPQESDAHR